METLKELYNYFVEKYFTVDTSALEHISFDGGVSIPLMFIGLFLGVLVAAASAIHNKRVLGDALRHIIRSGASTPETAKTLSELGYAKNTFVRSGLKYGTALRKYVRCVEDDERFASLVPDEKGYYPKIKTDLGTAHFYVPEEKRIAAELRYEKAGTGWLQFFAILIGGTVLLVLLIKIFPDLMMFVDNFVGGFKSNGNILM